MSLKIGVVGTGAIGRDHVRRCAKVLQGVEVVAVSDIAADIPNKLVKDLSINAKVYTDGVALIHSPEVEAIIVTSSDPTHKTFVLEAIKAGKPVFCEKPLAETAQDCKAIVEAEMKGGQRLVQVGFMRRYDEGYLALKKVLDQQTIGQPLMVHCAHRNQSVGDNYTTDMGITSTLIHELDIFRWLLDDDYASVQVIFPRATTHTHAKLRDPQLIILETVKGIRIVAEVFVNCQYGYDIQCEIVGELGTAKLPEPQAIYTRLNAELAKPLLVDWIDRFIGSYDIELQAYIDGVRHGKITGPSSWDGYAAAVAADACIRAQSSGVLELIEQPITPDFYKNHR